MERIKRPEEVILTANDVLLEVIIKKNGLVAANESGNIDYMVLIAKGENTPPCYEVGDIVIDITPGQDMPFKTQDRAFVKIPSYAIRLAVKPDNFDNKPKSVLTIN